MLLGFIGESPAVPVGVPLPPGPLAAPSAPSGAAGSGVLPLAAPGRSGGGMDPSDPTGVGAAVRELMERFGDAVGRALAQIWGYLNGQTGGYQPPAEVGGATMYIEGKYSINGNTTITWTSIDARAGSIVGSQCIASQAHAVTSVSGSRVVTGFCGFGNGSAGSSSQCGPYNWFIGINTKNPNAPYNCRSSGYTIQVASTDATGFITQKPLVFVTATPNNPSGTDGDAKSLLPFPAYVPGPPLPYLPFPDAEPVPLEEETLRPLPGTAPLAPAPFPPGIPLVGPAPGDGGSPGPFVGPLPSLAPLAAPVAAPFTGASASGVAVLFGPDGRPLPAAEGAVAVTPVDLLTLGDLQLLTRGFATAGTLEAIGIELGKQQAKQEAILARQGAQGGDGGLGELLLDLLDLLKGAYPAGKYQLYPVCELDSNGIPMPPREAEWGGGIGATSEISAKIDAIAELLQFSKELRQPVCHVKAVGRPVTVNFLEQLDA